MAGGAHAQHCPLFIRSVGGRVEVMGWGRVRVVVVVEGLGRVEEALVGRVVVGGARVGG